MTGKIEINNLILKKNDIMAGKPGVPPRTILNDISLSVAPGEILAVLGPSGSGKTSLLRLLNRLEDPTSGEIFLDGRNINDYPVRDLRRTVGLVPQVPIMFEGTVKDNLMYGPSLVSADPTSVEKQIMELLPHCGFPPQVMERDPGSLSVGEKQRVSILRVLLNRPEVLLFDEPTSALDPQSAMKLLGLIGQINRSNHTTVIMVTHIPIHAVETAHRAVLLIEGRIKDDGRPSDVIQRNDFHNVGSNSDQ